MVYGMVEPRIPRFPHVFIFYWLSPKLLRGPYQVAVIKHPGEEDQGKRMAKPLTGNCN